VIAVMDELGIDLRGQNPRPLTRKLAPGERSSARSA
jgi:hypothetical protein